MGNEWPLFIKRILHWLEHILCYLLREMVVGAGSDVFYSLVYYQVFYTVWNSPERSSSARAVMSEVINPGDN